MHLKLQKAIDSALNDLDTVSDDVVKQRYFGEDKAPVDDVIEAQANPKSARLVGGGESPDGVTVSKTSVTTDMDGQPALDGDEASPQEEEITGDLLEQLKGLLSKQ